MCTFVAIRLKKDIYIYKDEGKIEFKKFRFVRFRLFFDIITDDFKRKFDFGIGTSRCLVILFFFILFQTDIYGKKKSRIGNEFKLYYL